MNKKSAGIIRNKTSALASFKKKQAEKKNRFQKIGKDDDDPTSSNTTHNIGNTPSS